MLTTEQVSSVAMNPPANARDAGSIPESGRPPGESNGNPFQYSCLENPIDRGAWKALMGGAMPSSVQSLSPVRLFAIPWIVAHQDHRVRHDLATKQWQATGLDNYLTQVSFILVPKKGNAKECANYCTSALISHTSNVMLKILQSRLQQYINHELPDVQAGFRKRRRTRDQIANIHWIIKKAKVFQKKHLLLYW